MPLIADRLRARCLAWLIIFLPLSAWLVSLTGQDLVGLVRDLLLALFIVFSLIGRFTSSVVERRQVSKQNAPTWLAIIFIVLVLASYFYRQDSVEQWLRGVRYLVEPLLLFVTLQMFPLTLPHKKLWRALGLVTILVITGAVIELFVPNFFRTTFDASGRGYLGQIHLASSLTRLQSTLAGPNALGLFLMIALLLWPIWQKNVPKYLAISAGGLGLLAILLTFSRSSYLGLFVGAAALLVAGRTILKDYTKGLTVGLAVALLLIASLFIWKPQELSRDNSNAVRLEQYQRLWEQKSEIGFWGRGAGAAGLVSVDRLDGGPNFYTENSYLDAYEAAGLLAALAYLGFWILLIRSLLMVKTVESIAVGAAVLALAVAGPFINHYTGQAAIWLVLLFAGLALGQVDETGEGFLKPTA